MNNLDIAFNSSFLVLSTVFVVFFGMYVINYIHCNTDVEFSTCS